jgi:hypothetical protein
MHTMVETGLLTNQFFIATPNLLDPGFFFTTLPFVSERKACENTGAIFVSPSVEPTLSINIHPAYGDAGQV